MDAYGFIKPYSTNRTPNFPLESFVTVESKIELLDNIPLLVNVTRSHCCDLGHRITENHLKRKNIKKFRCIALQRIDSCFTFNYISLSEICNIVLSFKNKSPKHSVI
jgi:hypothetical protein